MMDRWQNLEILSNAVLHVLYHHALKSNVPLSTEQIAQSFEGRISSSFLEKAIERLEDHGFVHSYLSMDDATEYEIEGAGIDAYQKRMEIPDSPISSIQSKGIGWLFEGAGVGPNQVDQGASQDGPLLDSSGQPFVLDASTLASVPAADRIVQLDHNSAQYKEAMETGEALVEGVRSSNAYATSDPDDQERRVAELEAGYRLLRAKQADSITVKGVLIGVIAYLAAKFADQPIGELAGHAWNALKALFGW